MAEDCMSTQLIDDNGALVASSLHKFVESVKLSECGVSYAVVAIMGPQSSGKSTLLNHLFSTKFDMMNNMKGRKQTTKGVWMAKAVNIDPVTIVLDIEGSDGNERGEDNLLERQTALFALALADVVLINMWCTEIGRVSGARRMLKTVFQVMTQIFPPSRTTILFVIRDKTNTPLEHLESDLREDLQKKPEARKNAALGDFFNVHVTALCNFERDQEEFIEQVGQLRERFDNSIAAGGLAGDRQGRAPGSGFSLTVESIWKAIKDNKDLDLPSQKVMVATVRCGEIAREQFTHLSASQGWLALDAAAKAGLAPEFGPRLTSILTSYLSQYDKEAMYYDEGIRDDRRLELHKAIVELVRPTYEGLLDHYLSQAKTKFETELQMALSRGEGFAASSRDCKVSSMLLFDSQCQDADVQQATHLDALSHREKLLCDIDAHTSSIRDHMLNEIITSVKKNLSESIGVRVPILLKEDCSGGSWHMIREVLKHESETADSEFLSSVAGFELDESTTGTMLYDLGKYAECLVETKAKEEAAKVLTHMTNRFTTAFTLDKDSILRKWTAEDDIKKITEDARLQAVKMLSVMTVIRLKDTFDSIENILISSLLNQSSDVSGDLLAGCGWNRVCEADTMIKPLECKPLWRQFLEENANTISLATVTQERNKAKEVAPTNIVGDAFNAAGTLIATPFKIIGEVANLASRRRPAAPGQPDIEPPNIAEVAVNVLQEPAILRMFSAFRRN